MAATDLLPNDFKIFISKCYNLIKEVKNYEKNREDFQQFEEAFDQQHYAKKDFKKQTLFLLDLFNIWNKIAKYICQRKKYVKYSNSHQWHYLVCNKTLIEIKKDLKLYKYPRKSLVYQKNIVQYSEIVICSKYWNSIQIQKEKTPNLAVIGKKYIKIPKKLLCKNYDYKTYN